jgi:FkbM family methyltransferase
MTESFGALKPSPLQEYFRALGHRLPDNYFGRKAASLLLGPAGGRARRAYDVAVFGSQKARLHPHDNICEKRVYLTPQLWDPQERTFLAGAIAAHDRDEFVFVDIGANVGLYTLFARAAAMGAGRSFRAICVEPDPEMRARLNFNIAASGAADAVSILGYAATEGESPVRFSINHKSRGLSRIAEYGEIEVEGRGLAALLAPATRIDAMKIDIEGHEHAALAAFFREAPDDLLPRLLALETSHEAPARSARALAIGNGYRIAHQTRLNAILARA